MPEILVAALYVDPRGPYYRMAGVDCWGIGRDARLYDGPHPVVAHPPCGAWGRLKHLHRRGDADCAPRALEQVQRFGGVLEHPAASKLFASLPWPGELPIGGCYSVAINQSEWGHCARKPTWLYLVGVPREALEEPPFPGREPTHWVSGGRGRAGKKAKTTPVPEGIRVTSRRQRVLTPDLFAAYLVRLARAAAAHRRAA